MNAPIDHRLLNIQEVKKLDGLVREHAVGAVVGLLVVPAGAEIDVHLVGTGDERVCVAAAIHLLLEAKALIQREGPEASPENWTYLSRIRVAALALTDDAAFVDAPR